MGNGLVYKNVKLYAGGYDFSGNSNQVQISYAFDKVPMLAFNKPCKYSKPGLPQLSYSLQGQANLDDGPADIESALAGLHGVEDVPWIWCPVSGALGEAAYLAKAVGLDYTAGGAVGGSYDFTAAGEGQTKLIRATVMENSAKTTTGNGTGRQLGAVSSTQKLYGVLQVLAVSGTNPTLDVVVQSDNAAGFASPLTRLTFTQKTAIGAQYLTADGPITDDYFRAAVTIGGTNSPSFTIALALGIH